MKRRRKNKTSRKQLDYVRDWDRRHPAERRAITKRWEQSEKGRAWLAANQKKKNAARKAWRARKRAEEAAKKDGRTPGPSNTTMSNGPREDRASPQPRM